MTGKMDWHALELENARALERIKTLEAESVEQQGKLDEARRIAREWIDVSKKQGQELAAFRAEKAPLEVLRVSDKHKGMGLLTDKGRYVVQGGELLITEPKENNA